MIIREIWQYRQMIFSLVKRELRGRYKGSFLGFLWTFLNPLLQLVVYTIVFSVIMRAGIEDYYLFLFVALIPWIMFSTSVAGGCSCILNHKDMVTKIYFPREVLPIAHVTTAMVNMLYSFIVVFIVVLFAGVQVQPMALLCLPVIVVVEYILSIGMALITSSLTVFFRDLEHIMGILVMSWQFLTPVMYSVDQVPEELWPIFQFNPMTQVITAYRDILYYGTMPHIATLSTALIWGVISVLLGFVIFQILQRRFAEEL